ncbi:MAG: OmpA family protein [Rhodospirillaceae bacterium]
MSVKTFLAGLRIAGVLLGSVIAVGAGGAVAQDAVMMGKNPSECEIAAGLGVAKPGCPPVTQHAPKKVGTRGLSIGNVDAMPTPPPAEATQTPKSASSTPAPRRQQHSAAFQITFEFGSAQLTGDATQVLDKIGAVLTAPDAGTVKFRIAGHTDGIGSSTRNQKLSQERAQAVKDYLIEHFSIDGSRLQALGKGARELLNRTDPGAAENRRVEITNLGS